MYREDRRAPKEPTVIEYSSKRVRVLYILIAFVLLAASIGLIASMHVTHITCSRRHDDESGTCRVRRYGLVGSFDEELAAGEIASFDVTVRTGSKGQKYAEVRLLTTPESHRPTMELETGSVGYVSPADALAARSEFVRFQTGLSRSLDLWIDISIAKAAFILLSGLGLGAFAVAMLREQLGQLRRIRIVVIPERQVVAVRGKEIPWSEIEDVTIDSGRAHFWSSGRNEIVPGHRLRFVRRTGSDVLATKEYRAGAPGAHAGARRAILRALGRDGD